MDESVKPPESAASDGGSRGGSEDRGKTRLDRLKAAIDRELQKRTGKRTLDPVVALCLIGAIHMDHRWETDEVTGVRRFRPADPEIAIKALAKAVPYVYPRCRREKVSSQYLEDEVPGTTYTPTDMEKAAALVGERVAGEVFKRQTGNESWLGTLRQYRRTDPRVYDVLLIRVFYLCGGKEIIEDENNILGRAIHRRLAGELPFFRYRRKSGG